MLLISALMELSVMELIFEEEISLSIVGVKFTMNNSAIKIMIMPENTPFNIPVLNALPPFLNILWLGLI